jgi:hypothetical protein
VSFARNVSKVGDCIILLIGMLRALRDVGKTKLPDRILESVWLQAFEVQRAECASRLRHVSQNTLLENVLRGSVARLRLPAAVEEFVTLAVLLAPALATSL